MISLNKENRTSDENKKYFILMFILIISGAGNSIFLKLQNVSFDLILNAPYIHPWFQSYFIYIGELFIGIIWILNRSYIKKEQDEEQTQFKEGFKKLDAPILIYSIPCIFDIISASLLNISLLGLSTSTFQMLRGGVILFTCLFSILILRRKIRNYQYFGIFLTLIGIIIVGLSTMINSSSSSKSQRTTSIYSIGILILGLSFTSLQFIYEERILDKYNTHPLQLLGYESIFGLVILGIILIIMQNIRCEDTFLEGICSENEKGELNIENSLLAIRQILSETSMIFYVIGQTITISVMNLAGVYISKYASSASRSIIGSSKSLIIWMFFIFIEVNSYREYFSALQLLGFLIIVIANMVYNRLITFNILDLDYYFRNDIYIILADNENKSIEEDYNVCNDNDLNVSHSYI